jgi:hypothetical protein
MDQINSNREWNQKVGTLSEKTAFKGFGLTEDDIITAINAGKLQSEKKISSYMKIVLF